MQSYNEAISEFGCKSSIVPKTTWTKGKENGINAPAGPQPSTQKTPLEKSQEPPRSRLPIPSKTKEALDFQKLHQSWQNQFQKGKAVNKRPCTRPQPFNFSQPRDRSRVTTDKGEPVNPQANPRRREPLSEVTLGQKNQGSKDAEEKGGSEEFKADPAALATILSHIGVSNAAAGKLSLAQRVPMRGSSITQSSNISKNTMVRSSMYAVLRSQSASSNLDRVSCFSRMQTKVNDQKPVFKQNPLVRSHVPDSSLKELAASNLGDELQSQENPVLQQMNQTGQAQASTTVTSDQVTEGGENSAATADGCEKNTLDVDSSTGKMDPKKMMGAASVEFVTDSQALASILSNTGVAFGNCGKLSLAQRVPVQSRNVPVKSVTISSGPVPTQATTPKPCFGRMSTMAVPLKDIIFSPCRVPKTLMTDKPSSGSARRVPQLNASAMKFTQPYSSSKQLFFPKTPRALALEMANRNLEADLSDTKPSTRSTIKWADESPPVSEKEPKIEEVAVRLFLDGDGPEETDNKKQDPAEESDRWKGSESLTTIVHERLGAALSENSVNNADVAASAAVSQDSQIRRNIDHPALLSLSHPADPPVQYPSIVSSLKAPVPLSFLAHPVVQALRSHTLGPYSLPDIARLRIQAAVSAKQRFWETCLDEECAFYTSRGAVSSYRKCTDPVSSLLERQEALHFTPIIPGEP